MSEIQSIANGTFTIGQTSATNFIAGPGIKIDEPSAGTVRIGNDETVLWSGDINVNNLTGALSEPVSSFNKVKILTKINTSTPDAKQWFEFDTDREYYTMLGGLTDGSDTSAGAPYIGLVMVSLTGGIVKYVNGYQHMLRQTEPDHRLFASICKVVGINRISGSNA